MQTQVVIGPSNGFDWGYYKNNVDSKKTKIKTTISKIESTIDIHKITLKKNSMSIKNKVHMGKESGGKSWRYEA